MAKYKNGKQLMVVAPEVCCDGNVIELRLLPIRAASASVVTVSGMANKLSVLPKKRGINLGKYPVWGCITT